MQIFLFDLSQHVRIHAGGETGTIVGRAQYTNSVNSYLVRYTDGTGCAVERWWSEDAISVV